MNPLNALDSPVLDDRPVVNRPQPAECRALAARLRAGEDGATAAYDRFVDNCWTPRLTTLDAPALAELFVMATGLAGEAGEVLELLKKHVRDGTPVDAGRLVKELGDAQFYLGKIAHTFGFSLAEVMASNVDKLAARFEAGTVRGAGSDR